MWRTKKWVVLIFDVRVSSFRNSRRENQKKIKRGENVFMGLNKGLCLNPRFWGLLKELKKWKGRKQKRNEEITIDFYYLYGLSSNEWSSWAIWHPHPLQFTRLTNLTNFPTGSNILLCNTITFFWLTYPNGQQSTRGKFQCSNRPLREVFGNRKSFQCLPSTKSLYFKQLWFTLCWAFTFDGSPLQTKVWFHSPRGQVPFSLPYQSPNLWSLCPEHYF